MITTLTDGERKFLECYNYGLMHGMTGPALRWVGENKLTVMDFGNLLILYQAEGLTWGETEPTFANPWTPEELKDRNADLLPEAEAVKESLRRLR